MWQLGPIVGGLLWAAIKKKQARSAVASDSRQQMYVKCRVPGCTTTVKAGELTLCWQHRNWVSNTSELSQKVDSPPEQQRVTSVHGIDSSCRRSSCDLEAVAGEQYCEQHLYESRAYLLAAAKAREELQARESARFKNLCTWKGCNAQRLLVGGHCALHKREYEQLRARRCGNKIRHTSKEEADAEALQMFAKTNGDFNVYHCNFCEFFHVGNARRC